MKTADELFDGSNAHLLEDSAVHPSGYELIGAATVEEGRKNLPGKSPIEVLNSPKIGMITISLPAELIGKAVQYAVWEERDRSKPPCLECGATTPEEAETMCICAGDKDHCHGCELWPG